MRIARIGGSWLAIVCLLLTGLSCSDDDDDNPVDPGTPFPHAVPTAATMQIDLQELKSDGIAPAPEGLCHALTAVVVTWVNANVVVRLAIPVAAFQACITQSPVYLGDQTWRWTASGGSGANAWTAELTGEVINPTVVQWTMRVSGTQNGFDRFLWFDGTCDVDARDGVWHYYDHTSPESSVEIVRC
ncbi:MAG: hypothetical protein GF346_08250, partial [Candidatus Eisenbacteria bacterium]|nr:hypothetical protein [Candidatus Latescibacterota bacterium]MBD3302424.1 hypothetical protein [Candidatus Eisenbacteria bacterium]